MKLSKILRKVSVAVSALMIAGMLAACSSPSGGGSSGSGSGGGNTASSSIDPDKTYIVFFGPYREGYKDNFEANGKERIDLFDSCNCVEGTDYIVSENKIRITALGMKKLWNSDSYDWMYENNLVGSMPTQDLKRGWIYEEYKEGEDYTYDDENRIVNILSENFYNALKNDIPDSFI